MFQALAPDLYRRDLAALGPEPRPDLTAVAQDFAATFAATLNRNEATARGALMGEVDPHALIEALASTQSAVETVVTVRDRVVEAYQDILRMPI